MSESDPITPKTCAVWFGLLCWIIFCLTTGQLHTACRRDGEYPIWVQLMFDLKSKSASST